MLPKEMGCGSGMTCWRRLEEWQEAGVWQELHTALLDKLGAGVCGFFECGCAARAKKGALVEPGSADDIAHAVGANPTNRGKQGTKRHLIVEGRGTPLGFVL